MKKLFVFTITLGILISCQTGNEIEEIHLEATQLLKPTEPEIIFETNIPSIPLDILTIIDREHFHHHQDIDKVEYVESRLVELYPNQGYEGLLTSLKRETDKFMEEYSEYERELCQYNEAMGIEKSIDEEVNMQIPADELVELLELSPAQAMKFKDLDLIASKTNPISKNELSGLGKGRLAETDSQLALFSVVALTVGGFAVLPAVTAVNNSLSKANEFYGGKVAGERSDAFVHIFMSVQLRRWYTKAGSQLLMTAYENHVSPNDYVGDTQMDLHNNIIGRDTKYTQFRGSYGSGYGTWANNIRNYLSNGTVNGLAMDQIANWNINNNIPSSSFLARRDISRMRYSSTRYVYYANTSWTNTCYGVHCAAGFECNYQTGQCEPDPTYTGCNSCAPDEICAGGQCIPL